MKINAIYRIFKKPTIYLSSGIKYWNLLPISHNQPAYLLAHPMWHFSWKSLPIYRQQKKLLVKKNIQLILLNNCQHDHEFAKLFGFRSYLINQNIHTCENIFTILDNCPKQYDAVYTAAAKKYKRLPLAKNINKLYVITYGLPKDKANNPLPLKKAEPSLKHAIHNLKFLSSEEVNIVLNQSACGLALSKKEGAMWASMEYLMAGLPVVTTRNKGGRDFFFDSRYVQWVKDTPEAVKEGMRSLLKLKCDPHFIREHTLQKVYTHRKKFYELLKRLSGPKNSIHTCTYEAVFDHLWGGNGIEKHHVIP